MRTVTFTLLLCSLASSSAWAIDCQSSAGAPSTGWWAWRDIDGRKCWFIKTGAMPPKSELHWRAKETREVRATEPSLLPQSADPAQASSFPQDERKPSVHSDVLGRFTVTRAKPINGPAPRLLHEQVDLMNSTPLSSIPLLDGRPRTPAIADSFDARFKALGVDQP